MFARVWTGDLRSLHDVYEGGQGREPKGTFGSRKKPSRILSVFPRLFCGHVTATKARMSFVRLLLLAAPAAAAMCAPTMTFGAGALRLRGGADGGGAPPAMPPGFDGAAMNNMFSNPAFQNMAQSLMNNPEFKQKMDGMMKNETLMQVRARRLAPAPSSPASTAGPQSCQCAPTPLPSPRTCPL